MFNCSALPGIFRSMSIVSKVSLRFGKDYKMSKEFTKWFCFGFKTTTSDQYDVSRLVLSQIVTRPAAQQLHNNNTEFVWWVVASYQLSGSLPTHVEVELGCDNFK